MEGPHEVGSRPFMPASTLSGRSVALLRVNLDDYTSEGRSISNGNYTRTDFSPGPKLNIDGKVLTTHLCLILDDHSRLITEGTYYLTADSYAFHQTLKKAVQRRGIPYKLYTDLGKPFTNKHTQIICANLGIRLLH